MEYVFCRVKVILFIFEMRQAVFIKQLINLISKLVLSVEELDPPLMPSEDVIDEVSRILTITGFKDKIERIRKTEEGDNEECAD